MKTTLRLWQTTLLASCVALSAGGQSALADGGPRDNSALALEKKAINSDFIKELDNRKTVEVFVELNEPSVAAWVAKKLAAKRSKPTTAAQLAHAERLLADQEVMKRALLALGGRYISHMKAGANGLKFRIPKDKIAAIRSLPGVKNVVSVQQFRPNHFHSIPWIGADKTVDLGLDGSDMTIAIIDTGIDYIHENFGGSGSESDYASNDPNVLEPGTFPTAKVIGGYDFAGGNYNAGGEGDLAIPKPDSDPIDYTGHGSHVAGSAAGLGVADKIGHGVAPGAKLLAVKVFGDIDGSSSVIAEGVEYSLDPNGDGAIDDRADVINMSLGSDLGRPDDPSAIAAANAAALGVIVVVAAGNSGNGVPYVHGSPAIAEESISVAASVAGGVPEFALIVDGAGLPENLRAQYSGVSPSLEELGSITGTLEIAEPLDACSEITNDLSGSIALLKRGTCAFTVKLNNAAAAGAEAVVVYNNVPGDPIVIGGDPVDIAAAMVSLADGEALHAAVSSGQSVAVTFSPDAFFPYEGNDDTLAGFSSRGPGNGDNSFKPDISAPGFGIVSTATLTGTDGVALSGTSMATPHIAGVQAVMKQKFPGVEPKLLKAMIQNSSVSLNIDGPGTNTPYPLSLQGVGRVQVDKAVQLTSAAYPGGVSFGRLNPLKGTRVTKDITVTNLSDSPRVYRISMEAGQALAGARVNVPSAVSVPANGTAKFSMMLSMDPARLPAEDGFYSQTEMDGWIVLDDGKDTLRVGYMAVLDPASFIQAAGSPQRAQIVGNRGLAAGIAEGFTLAGLDGELLNGKPNAIKALGWRTDEIDGSPVIQFGIASEANWNTMSEFYVALYLDTNQDGVEDKLVYAIDSGTLGGGDPSNQIITALLDLTTGSLLQEYVVVTDNNDAAAIFTADLFGQAGFLEEGATTFDYRAEFHSLTGDDFDFQTGTIDLAKEIKVNTSSLALDPRERLRIDTVSGGDSEAQYMWLAPTNPIEQQLIVQ